jgi:hypothetical protein
MGLLDNTSNRSFIGPRAGLPQTLTFVALAGAVSGIAAKLADQTQVDWLNDLGTYPAIWMLIVVAFGRWFRTPLLAAAHTAIFYVAMVGGYYLYAHQILGFGIVRDETIWFIAAITIAPLAAAALNWSSHSSHPASGIIPAGIASIVLASGPLNQYLLHLLHAFPEGARLHPVQAVIDLAVALTVIAVIPKHPTTRLLAAALTIPGTWLAPHLIQLATNLTSP